MQSHELRRLLFEQRVPAGELRYGLWSDRRSLYLMSVGSVMLERHLRDGAVWSGQLRWLLLQQRLPDGQLAGRVWKKRSGVYYVPGELHVPCGRLHWLPEPHGVHDRDRRVHQQPVRVRVRSDVHDPGGVGGVPHVELQHEPGQ